MPMRLAKMEVSNPEVRCAPSLRSHASVPTNETMVLRFFASHAYFSAEANIISRVESQPGTAP